MSERAGLIHYYYGNGKGKTTAAFGLATRALGHKLRVVAVQFLKSSPSGEVEFFSRVEGMTILRGKAGGKFVFQMSDEEKQATLEMHVANFREAVNAARAGDCDVLLLDEVSDACKLGVFPLTELLDFLSSKPGSLEVVMTGHDPLPELVAIADYATEMRKEKHPYDKGVMARVGIEK